MESLSEVTKLLRLGLFLLGRLALNNLVSITLVQSLYRLLYASVPHGQVGDALCGGSFLLGELGLVGGLIVVGKAGRLHSHVLGGPSVLGLYKSVPVYSLSAFSVESERALELLLSGHSLLFGHLLLSFFLLRSLEVVLHIFLNLRQSVSLDTYRCVVGDIFPPFRELRACPDSKSGSAQRSSSGHHSAFRVKGVPGLELFGEALDAPDGVDAHHHLLLGESILKELVKVDAGLEV